MRPPRPLALLPAALLIACQSAPAPSSGALPPPLPTPREPIPTGDDAEATRRALTALPALESQRPFQPADWVPKRPTRRAPPLELTRFEVDARLRVDGRLGRIGRRALREKLKVGCGGHL